MSRLRVLVVTPDYPPSRGGIQTLLGGLVTHADGWETRVLTVARSEARPAPVRAPFRGPAGRLWQRASVAGLNLRAIREGLAWRPDAVVCGHVVTSPGVLVLGELLSVPVVQYVHADELAHRPRLARVALARSTATIAQSQHGAGLARALGADPARVRVISPGVDAGGATAREAVKARVPTILTVARIAERYKGFDVMLRAMPLVRARIPGARWVLIGDGPLRGELERTARAWGLGEAVRFLGHVSDPELEEWFGRAHVFAMLSRVPADGGGEGYGLVYLEAGAHGLPCVAGNAGAASEAVIDGETGLLVTATDHAEAAAALIALLDDPDRAAALGAAGHARARSLSWQRMAVTVEALVADLIATTR